MEDTKISIGKKKLIAPCVQAYTEHRPLKASEGIIGKGMESPYQTSPEAATIYDPIWIEGVCLIFIGIPISNMLEKGAESIGTRNIHYPVLAFRVPCEIKK